MAKGDVSNYKEIKKMDVMEFWTFFDKWKETIARENERNQNNKAKK